MNRMVSLAWLSTLLVWMNASGSSFAFAAQEVSSDAVHEHQDQDQDPSQQHLRQRELQGDYTPFPDGTPIRNEFDDGWFFGELVSYDPAQDTYEAVWSDGETRTYHDRDETALKVAAAAENYQPHNDGTRCARLANNDISNPQWVWGTIMSFDTTQRSYVIGFDDDENDDQPGTYTDLSQVDTWVRQVGKYTPYADGTMIRHQFSGLWFFGTLDAYDPDEFFYVATWSDGQKNQYHDLGLVDDKVHAAGKDYQPYETGQKLLRNGQSGTIISFDPDDRDYLISFDGSVKTVVDLVSIDNEVRAYQDSLEAADNGGDGGDGNAQEPSAPVGSGVEDNGDGAYVPFDNGTLIRHEFDDGFLFGTIIGFDNANGPVYKVRWSDGVENTSTDIDVLTGRVHNAGKNYVAFEVGTQVRRFFADSEDWFFGVISSYDAEKREYRIIWSDDIEEPNSNLVEMDEMVRAASTLYVYYENGVAVQDENNQAGSIVGFNPTTQTYTVRWTSSGVDESFTNLSLMDQMVDRAKDKEPLPIGTPVRKFFDDQSKWFWGEIAKYVASTDTYSVVWHDNTETDFVGLDELGDLVKQARTFEPYGRGTSVRKKFGTTHWWFFGEVQAYDAQTQTYSIQWSDDEITTTKDLTEMDELVLNADQDYEPYGVGTRLYHKFGSDGWFWGSITAFDPVEKIYTLSWMDGTVDSEGDLEDIDEFVNSGLQKLESEGIFSSTESSKNVDPVGTGYMAITGALALTVLGLISYIVIDKRRQNARMAAHPPAPGRSHFQDNLNLQEEGSEDDIEAELPEVA